MNIRDAMPAVGLRFDESKLPVTIAEMRKIIEEARYDSSTINSAMMAAEAQRLSDSDTFVLLAFTALVSLQRSHEQAVEMLNRAPPGPFTKDGKAYRFIPPKELFSYLGVEEVPAQIIPLPPQVTE